MKTGALLKEQKQNGELKEQQEGYREEYHISKQVIHYLTFIPEGKLKMKG